MSDFARQLRDGLTQVALSVRRDARMGGAARRVAKKMQREPDLMAAMSATVALILALEEAEAAAKAAQERARAALVEALDSTSGSIRAGIHTASVRKGSASVVITDDAAIPPEYMRQPAPVADKAAIAKALKDGREVPGAVLRNGAPGLTIRVTHQDKEKAA
jgi:hypothetical protein